MQRTKRKNIVQCEGSVVQMNSYPFNSNSQLHLSGIILWHNFGNASFFFLDFASRVLWGWNKNGVYTREWSLDNIEAALAPWCVTSAVTQSLCLIEWLAVVVLKLLIMLEEGELHFHFAVGPTNYVVGSAEKLYQYRLCWDIISASQQAKPMAGTFSVKNHEVSILGFSVMLNSAVVAWKQL